MGVVVTIPVGARGVDYSFARPDPAALRASGFVFAARYISVPPASKAKNLTVAERDALHAAGLAILLLWEMSATAADGGYELGKSHGKSAAVEAAKLGYPQGLPIIAAWDTDTIRPQDATKSRPSNLTAHTAYGHGFADGVEPAGYRLGVYGDVDIIDALQDRSECNHVAGASSWSHGKIDTDPLVHMRQTISGSTPSWDVNLVRRPVDMWLPGQPDAPTPSHPDVLPETKPIPPPTTQENDDMIVSGRGQIATLSGGYLIGISATTAAGVIPLPLSDSEWDEHVANSDAKKAHDKATAATSQDPVQVHVTVSAQN